jgi:hypothetical protein
VRFQPAEGPSDRRDQTQRQLVAFTERMLAGLPLRHEVTHDPPGLILHPEDSSPVVIVFEEISDASGSPWPVVCLGTPLIERLGPFVLSSRRLGELNDELIVGKLAIQDGDLWLRHECFGWSEPSEFLLMIEWLTLRAQELRERLSAMTARGSITPAPASLEGGLTSSGHVPHTLLARSEAVTRELPAVEIPVEAEVVPEPAPQEHANPLELAPAEPAAAASLFAAVTGQPLLAPRRSAPDAAPPAPAPPDPAPSPAPPSRPRAPRSFLQHGGWGVTGPVALVVCAALIAILASGGGSSHRTRAPAAHARPAAAPTAVVTTPLRDPFEIAGARFTVFTHPVLSWTREIPPLPYGSGRRWLLLQILVRNLSRTGFDPHQLGYRVVDERGQTFFADPRYGSGPQQHGSPQPVPANGLSSAMLAFAVPSAPSAFRLYFAAGTGAGRQVEVPLGQM